MPPDRNPREMQILKGGSIYFAVVFGAGFILGPLRILGLVPRVGERLAELIETPIMLVVVILAARWVSRRLLRHLHRFVCWGSAWWR